MLFQHFIVSKWYSCLQKFVMLGYWISRSPQKISCTRYLLSQVRQSVKKKGIVTKCDGPGLWIWNQADAPLHAGIVPPFVYGSGHHSGWLLTEALASKYRALVDGSDAITLISPHQVSSRHYNGIKLNLINWLILKNDFLLHGYAIIDQL